ncbi:MAG: permease [Nannocystales bacterium]
MIEALAITTGSIVLGVGLGVLTRRKSGGFGALRVFAVAAVATAVALQMLPEALSEMGGTALLVFGGAIVFPGLLSPVLRRLRGSDTTSHSLSADLGFLGFIAHQVAEGVALGSFSTDAHADHGHEGLVLAVAAHTVPLTALLIAEALAHRTRRVAMGRAAALVLATSLGFALADLLHDVLPHALHSWLTAGVAGVLVHILFHDHGEDGPRTLRRKALESVAVVAGIALPIVAASATGRGIQRSVTDAFLELTLETAPMLLLGLSLGALLQLLGSKIPQRFLTSGGALRQAIRGVAVGAPLPLCACGVLPVAESLRKRGAGPALVIAFLVATPELGPETLTLTLRFMGGPYAVVRVVAALALALFAGLWFSRLVRSGADEDSASVSPSPPPPTRGAAIRVLGHFDELLLHVGPWAFVGLWAAAFVQVSLPQGSLAQTTAGGLDIWLVAAVAMPAYVCAASATPVAAVLLLKGISPGAILVGLLLGPATNVATVGVLRKAYGGRNVLFGVLGIALATIGMGYGVNALEVPITLPTRLDGDHAHGVLARASTVFLALAFCRQLWRGGLGPWLEILGGHHHHHHHQGEHGHDHTPCHGHEQGHSDDDGRDSGHGHAHEHPDEHGRDSEHGCDSEHLHDSESRDS